MNEQDGPCNAVPGAVLDTNTVLDMLLFDDPAARPLRAALQVRRLRWLGCERMADELRGVLQRPRMGRWAPGAATAAVLAFADAHMQRCPPPPEGVAPRCRDAADQVFIDLAWSARATWLLTRDKALLALARQARAQGLWVGTPAAWSALWLERSAGAIGPMAPAIDPGPATAAARLSA